MAADARAVFETTVNRLGQKAETLARSKVIYAYFHEYECHYGELAQIGKLEKRMAKLFPDDPKLSHFSRRFAGSGFDPTALRPIISPATQTRPKAGTAPAPIEATNNMTSSQRSPPRPTADRAPSPKRYLPSDESEYENNRPRKIARGESPLKGAAGRRLDQQKRTQQQQHHPHHQGRQGHAGPSMGGGMQHPLPPVPLPNKVAFLLSIIPRAETFPPVPRFKPQEVVRLLRDLNLPSGNQGPSRSRGPPPQQTMALPQGLPHGEQSIDSPALLVINPGITLLGVSWLTRLEHQVFIPMEDDPIPPSCHRIHRDISAGPNLFKTVPLFPPPP